MKTYLSVVAAFAVLAAANLFAATVPVPNGSVERPVAVPFPDPRIDSWQDNPKPPWYDESGGFLWDHLTGVFQNTEPGSANRKDNMDGMQAMWLFAVPQVGIFQDYNSIDWAHTEPTHEFNTVYRPGKGYRLTVGVIGGGGGMTNDVTLGIALYYRDASSNMVFVSLTNVAHSPEVFPTTTHFVDIPAGTAVVKASDPWANQNIGITVFSYGGQGYWDLDNVRLEEIEPPRLVTPRQGEIVVQSEPGLNFEILASSNLGANWTRIGAITNTTGNGTFIDSSTTKERRFYSARLIP